MIAYLGLGANLGSPMKTLKQAMVAIQRHPALHFSSTSRFYRSAPMGPQDQPDYVNVVVEVETDLSPLALLAACQLLEQDFGRVRLRHWGERSLDIDLLSMGDVVVNAPRLILPHPGIQYRDFVLLPWQEIAPDYTIPKINCPVGQLPLLESFRAKPCGELI